MIKDYEHMDYSVININSFWMGPVRTTHYEKAAFVTDWFYFKKKNNSLSMG